MLVSRRSIYANSFAQLLILFQFIFEGFSAALLVGGASAVSLFVFLLLTISLVVFRKRKTYRAKKMESVKKRESDHDNRNRKTPPRSKKKKKKKQGAAQQLTSLDRSPSTKRRSSSTSLQPPLVANAATHLQYRYGGPPTSPAAAVSVNYGATSSSSSPYACDEFGGGVVVVNPCIQSNNDRSTAIYRQNSSSTRSSSIRRIRSGTLEVAYQPLRPRGSYPSSPLSATGVDPSYDGGGGGVVRGGVGVLPGALRLDGGGGDGQRLSGGWSKPLVGGRTTYLVRYQEASLSPGTSSTGDTDSYSYVDLDPASRVVSADVVVSPVGMSGHSRRWNHSARFTALTGYDAASQRSSYASSLV